MFFAYPQASPAACCSLSEVVISAACWLWKSIPDTACFGMTESRSRVLCTIFPSSDRKLARCTSLLSFLLRLYPHVCLTMLPCFLCSQFVDVFMVFLICLFRAVINFLRSQDVSVLPLCILHTGKPASLQPRHSYPHSHYTRVLDILSAGRDMLETPSELALMLIGKY